jgi:hypothetical protein
VAESVRRGEQIGEVGLFPDSGGVVHVHWELCRNSSCTREPNRTEDPIPYTIGCFRRDRLYDTDRFVLTLPVVCDED